MDEIGVPEEMKHAQTLKILVILAISILLSNCNQSTLSLFPKSIHHSYGESMILRGMNLGNALEAPSLGEWGVTLKPKYFQMIHTVGFDSVRIPVRFSAHVNPAPPYVIDPEFLRLVDDVVNQGLESNLTVILDLHHYDAIMVDPAGQRQQFLAIWKQLAEHYRDAPPKLIFELLNEPNQKLDADTWNTLVTDSILLIRQSNPTRKLMMGGVNFYKIESLDKLKLPADDNLLATFHFYEPFHFTHQGASWVDGSGSWIGTTWEGSAEEKEMIANQLDQAAAWSQKNKIGLVMGEFGAIATADKASRQRWTQFVVQEAEKRNIGWLYWEFCSNFGVYDCQQDIWDADLLKALIVTSQ